MTRKKAKTRDQEVKEILLHFQSEYTRLRGGSFNLRARRGVRLMSQLLQSFDLVPLKAKVSRFLRRNDPEARYQGFTIGAFYRWLMKERNAPMPCHHSNGDRSI